MTRKLQPRFAYRHAECDGSVTKDQCGTHGGVYHGLHGWLCQSCGQRGVTISRTIVKPKPEPKPEMEVPCNPSA